MARLLQSLVVCEQCDALHRWRPLAPREVAHCSRCGAVLGRGHRLGVHALLALAIAALFMLLIASLTPIAELRMRGLHIAATLPEAIDYTWGRGQRLVAVTAAFTALFAPGALIALRLAVLLPMARGRSPRHLAWCMRVLHEMSRWSMVEVLMVAAAVSIVRIASMASAAPGPGMFAFGALSLLLAALESGGLKHLWMEPR
ncbi:MAG TPA: paraquat-inducible protein A [Albitalea sp.]|jgi:paraquat-inducible protein A|nr:paraquat-inducible protein A [Albitalea sp.]